MLRTFLPAMPGSELVVREAHLPYSVMVKRAGFAPPAFVFIRNPWSYLVSQWSWISHIGQAGMKDVPFETYFNRVRRNVDMGYPGDPGSALNFGPISWAWRHLEADKAQYIGRFENLREDIVKILCEIMGTNEIEGWIRDRIKRAGYPRRAPTPSGKLSGDYRKYYSPEMAAQVAGWDSALIERFGYGYN